MRACDTRLRHGSMEVERLRVPPQPPPLVEARLEQRRSGTLRLIRAPSEAEMVDEEAEEEDQPVSVTAEGRRTRPRPQTRTPVRI